MTPASARARWNSIVWLSLACLALAALACMAYVGRQQFGVLRGHVLQVDELFFSACAARGQIDGWLTIAGCHDNKSPLIYLLHGALQHLGPIYSDGPLKGMSAALLLLVSLLGARLAAQLAPAQPRLAAFIAAALIWLALLPSPSVLAVKTELLGMVFTLAALNLAVPGAWPPALGRVMLLGVCQSLALLSKQTYALMLPLGLAAIAMAPAVPGAARSARLRQGLVHLSALVFGLLLPWLVLLGAFQASDRLEEFLATTFLYPAVYGNAGAAPASLAQQIAWKTATVTEFLQFTPVHDLLALAGLLGLVRTRRPGALIVAAALAITLAMMLAAPLIFKYHSIPFWILAAVLAGATAAPWLGDPAEPANTRTLTAASLVLAALLGAGMTLRQNTGTRPAPGDEALLDRQAGRFAYVLGMHPQFYARGGFIPASSVQFPWALPGTPPTWAYNPPKADSAMKRWLTRQQQQNLTTLFRDFERTPPAYIVVMTGYARATGSTEHTDIPSFNDYLARHCTLGQPVKDEKGLPGILFRCQADPASR